MEIINKYSIFINDRKLDAQEIYHLTPYFSEFIYLEKEKKFQIIAFTMK